MVTELEVLKRAIYELVWLLIAAISRPNHKDLN
jgi:hypothetical protein